MKTTRDALPAVPLNRLVRLSGKKLVEYRKKLLAEMEKATGAMQDHADRLGDPKYPTAEADLIESAIRYQRAGIAHMQTIAKTSVDICLPNAERIHGGAGLPNQPETPTPLDGASC